VAVRLLELLALLATGTSAGVLFAVALSVVPAFIAMPPERYVYTHRMLGRNWDPTMPAIVGSGASANLALAILAVGDGTRALFAVAAILMLGVSAVSHLCNVPINRTVRVTDPDRMPGDWRDPRPLWRRWHLLRTVLAFGALVADGLSLAHP
jgi:uncharacterized membrane protein